ncbi:hypothetical protein B9Z19DRAFT_350076 [Tuber borchii]|uniref:Uncharacterized protein n=1 Tax=Tuber borchii TaxID=42251 RepID=A0A2T7A4U9_TUBBO|nr:hypothetical protein B9Z19DRAFT_350076 [Tuber borchii]
MIGYSRTPLSRMVKIRSETRGGAYVGSRVISGTQIRRGSILQYSVQTQISRVTSNVNSCSYTRCVSLFPTLHTNRHCPRHEFTFRNSETSGRVKWSMKMVSEKTKKRVIIEQI